MNWIESIIYGLVIGFSDFLPISSFAHSQLLLKLFGQTQHNPLQDLLIHIALFVAVFQCNRSLIDHARRQRIHGRNRGIVADSDLELRFIKNAILPMFLAFFLIKSCIKIDFNLAWVAVFSLLNGILLFSQSRMMCGNKTARHLSVLDSLLAGISGALFLLPGISRICVALTLFAARGISRERAANWAILLSLPALALWAIDDILGIISGIGSGVFGGNVVCYILSALAAYAAGYYGIRTIRRIAASRDFSGFAYYAWGISLFSFILYLTVV